MAAFIRRTGSNKRRWLMTPELDPGLARRREHGVAVAEARRHRLLDQHVDAGLRRQDRRPGVQRMRRADRHGLHAAPRASIVRDVGVGAGAVAAGEGLGARRGRRRRRRRTPTRAGVQRRGVDLADLAAADEGRPHGVPRQASGKYWATIARRKASDSAISSMPFMPSSMLIQPR